MLISGLWWLDFNGKRPAKGLITGCHNFLKNFLKVDFVQTLHEVSIVPSILFNTRTGNRTLMFSPIRLAFRWPYLTRRGMTLLALQQNRSASSMEEKPFCFSAEWESCCSTSSQCSMWPFLKATPIGENFYSGFKISGQVQVLILILNKTGHKTLRASCKFYFQKNCFDRIIATPCAYR